MDFQDLADALRAQAIANLLSPTAESVYRKICRAYSKRFNTPLHQVMELSPEFVILNYFEDDLEDIDIDDNLDVLMDRIYSIEDPEYESIKKEEFDAFAEQAEEEERLRLESGKPIHPALAKETTLLGVPDQKNTPEKDEPPKDNLPKGGYVNLSYLEREESEGGFES
jgi:hypothetical protein